MIVVPAGTSTARAIGNFDPPPSGCLRTSAESALLENTTAHAAALAE
jgi:hypothetical protein